MNPQDYCRKICKESGSNFVKTFHFLPRKRRLGFEAFYAFCRLVDDAVDESSSKEAAKEGLMHWSEEVENIYIGSPCHPIGHALTPYVEQYKIPREYLDELIAGCEMDLNQTSYQTFDDLRIYCYRVASCVGLVCLHLFEAELTPKTRQAAIDLGTAVQMTNILRDIIPDLDQNRIYLPKEDLKRFQVTPDDFRNANGNSGKIIPLLKFEINRARSYYNKAWANFPSDRKSSKPFLTAHMMGIIYETILNKIEKYPLRIFKEKMKLSGWNKFRISSQILAKLYLPL